jgi:WD40 repeat protein
VIVLSPNGRYIATGSDDGIARVWETLRGDQIARISHPGGATTAAFTPISGISYLLATVGTEGDIQLSHFTEKGMRFGSRLEHSGHVQNMTFSSDGRFLASVGEDATVMMWAMPSGEKIATFKQESAIDALAMRQDSRYLAYGDKGGTVTVRELINGEVIASLPHQKAVRTMTFIPHSDMLVTGSDDGIVRIWKLDDPSEIPAYWVNQRSTIHTITASPDGGCIGTACEDGTARLWIWEQGSKHYLPLNHKGPVHTLAFSPDSSHLATVERDGSIRVWDTTTGTLLNYLSQHHQVRAIAFNPNGTHLAIASNQQALLWEQDTGHIPAQFSHQAKTTTAIFSPDGKYLVTTGEDNTASVWIWQPADLLSIAAQRLTRNLTQEEWQQYLGDEPYRKTFALESWRSH